MLRTGCVFSERTPEDGLRVCVMGALTETDGKTPFADLARGKGIDYWIRPLAVPPKVLGDYYVRKKITFEQLVERYREHLAAITTQQEVRYWAERAQKENVTFLCYEDGPERCHRKILAETCKLLIPSLELYIG